MTNKEEHRSAVLFLETEAVVPSAPTSATLIPFEPDHSLSQ